MSKFYRSGAAAILMFFAFASFPGSAGAAFLFTEKPPEPKKPETRLDLTGDDAIVLAQIGPGKYEKKKSKGSEVDLPLALELISPDGWEPIVDKELADKQVSWKGDPEGDWVKSLEDMGRDEGVRFVINWKSQKIAAGEREIEELAGKTKAQQAAEKEEGGVDHVNAEAVEAKEDESAEEPVSVSEKPWKLEPGMLKDQLTKWADQADYSLIWDNEYDYRLDAGQTFYGDFKKAVNEAIRALYRNGARIKADIYTENQVLYISGGEKR